MARKSLVILILLQRRIDLHPSPLGPPAAWMKKFLRKFSIKYESQRWLLERAILRRGLESVHTAHSKTPTMGRIVKSAGSHSDESGSPEVLVSDSRLLRITCTITYDPRTHCVTIWR